MNTYGVILAGGDGTRFWPLSRKSTPKQMLNLTGREVMINETIDRLARLIPQENLYVVTNQNQAEGIRTVTAGRLPQENILAEPCARNTAPCIGYAAIELLRRRGDGVMVVTPSDAYVQYVDAYIRTLEEAVSAARMQDKLVTVGIDPTFPATGYGYIGYRQESKGSAKEVSAFREKPDVETAMKYIASGNYAWNSGIFVWQASGILRRFERYLPQVHEGLRRIGDAIGTMEEGEALVSIYPTLERISVDYGIMEAAAADGDVQVVPGSFGWSDVGSWDMLGALHPQDERGNVTVGETIAIEADNTVAYSSGKLVALVGVSDLVVVETADAVLVCHKDQAQNVRKITERLSAIGHGELV